MICPQWARLDCGPLVVVCAVAIPAAVFCVLSRSGLAALVSRRVFCLVMGCDGFQTQTRSHGCRARSGPKGLWQNQSRSVAERSGRANSVRSRMCGRDGVAGDVIITYQRGCMGSTSRQSQQRESGLQARRDRVVRKREKLEAWKPRIKSFRARIDAMGKNEGVQNGPGIFHEEGDLEEAW